MLPSSVKMEQFHMRLLILTSIIVISISIAAPVYDSVDSKIYDEPIYDSVDFETDGEYGEYFEGDMLLSKPEEEAIYQSADNGRNGLIDETKRWPNHTVVYDIHEEDFDKEQLSKIEDAFADIENHSCIKFRPKENDDEHAVNIKGSDTGCASVVGYEPNKEYSQDIKLAKDCFKHGTLIHEMMHTLGFRHMQSTYYRDDYIVVVWENVNPDHRRNFLKYSNDSLTDFGVAYDYDSIMHYSDTAFSADGNRTIIPLKENVTLGQRDGLSYGDILKLNKMYCEETDE